MVNFWNGSVQEGSEGFEEQDEDEYEE